MDDFYNKLKPHCNKCGRRSRCRHGHLLKCKREQRLFPPTNDSILLDQLIEVQQLDDTRCNIRTHTINKLQRVQQMVYLRENINNLTYREVHFPNEYIILKRLEEKNNLMHQNRFKVDQFFRSLKLQYQTMSTLLQNIPITSSTYSKQDLSQTDLIFKSSPLSENIDTNDTITNESFIKQNDNLSIADPMFITSYNEYDQQQYSQNATPSLVKPKKQNCEFDTAVIIDVTKYPQTTWDIPLHENYQQILSPIYIPNQTIYFDQYPQFQLESQNLNYTNQQQISTDSVFYNPVFSLSNNHLSPTHQTSESHTTSNPSTTNTNNNQVINKIKQILNTLQKNLLNKTISSTQIDSLNINQISSKINKSISMTSDSLITNRSIQTTYSVSKSKDILHIELDSLNSSIKLLNPAKNINRNQQTSEDDQINYTRSQTNPSLQSHHVTVQYMSPSFMFVLQILLLTCLLNQFLIYYFFGIIPNDILTSILTDNS